MVFRSVRPTVSIGTTALGSQPFQIFRVLLAGAGALPDRLGGHLEVPRDGRPRQARERDGRRQRGHPGHRGGVQHSPFPDSAAAAVCSEARVLKLAGPTLSFLDNNNKPGSFCLMLPGFEPSIKSQTVL